MAGLAGLEALVPSIVAFAAGAILLALAVLVFRAASHRAHNRAAAALFALWGLRNLAAGLRPASAEFHAASPQFPGPHVWADLAYAAEAVSVAFILLVAVYFPRPLAWIRGNPRLLPAFFLPSLPLLFLRFTPVSTVTGTPPVHLIIDSLTALAALIGATILVARRERTRDRVLRTRYDHAIGAYAPLAVGAGVQVAWNLGASRAIVEQAAAAWIEGAVIPGLELAFGFALTFTLLKYQLLNFEQRAKQMATRGLFVGTILGTLFVVHVGIEEFLFEEVFQFTPAPFLFAGLVSTALFYPLWRLAQGVTRRVFDAANDDDGDSSMERRAREIYHAQVMYALKDERIVPEERSILESLRKQLGLKKQSAQQIEQAARALSRA